MIFHRVSLEPSSASREFAARVAFTVAAIAFAVAIFIVDTFTPLGIAVAILYAVVVLLAGRFVRRGGLLLDSRAAMLEGGDNGPAIVPGDPGKSLLVKVIGYDDEPKMPKDGKLPGQQIADLTAWVKMGAPWPGADKGVVAVEKLRIPSWTSPVRLDSA